MAKSKKEINEEKKEMQLFYDELSQKTKQVKAEYPYLVYAIVGITPRQQGKFIKYINRLANLGNNMKSSDNSDENSGMKFVSTIVLGRDVLYVITPEEKYVSMFRSAIFTFYNYRNGTNFCNKSLEEAYSVDWRGNLVAPGIFPLMCVKNFSKLSEEIQNYLLEDIPHSLNVLAKLNIDEDKVIFSCKPPIDLSRRAATVRNSIIDDCKDKSFKLAIALNNYKDVVELDLVGKEVGAVTRNRSYFGRKDADLLSLAKEQTKLKKYASTQKEQAQT